MRQPATIEPRQGATEGPPMTAARHQFLWLDLETTGLDPRHGRPLEFAVVLCADARGDDLEILDEVSGVIHWPAAELAELQEAGHIDDYVYRMHTDSGLWSEVEASALTVADADAGLTEIVDDLTGGKAKAKVQLAGNSVGQFDLQWCRVWFPKFAARLHHRVFDVRSLMTAAELWCPVGKPTWQYDEEHRALPDIRQSVANARIARVAMRGLAR